MSKCLKYIYISLMLLMCMNTHAFAQSQSQFVIQGLYVGMSIDEFQTNFEGSGYTCKKKDTTAMNYFDCERSDLKYHWARMFVDKDGLASGIYLKCGVTNSCKFNVDEIVTLLESAGKFPENTIEEKMEQRLQSHHRVFITPTSLMRIRCRSTDPYARCTIQFNGQGKYRYPKF